MDVAADSLFLAHPDPMWIYDLETLRFLAVNNAAIVKYGYARDEFLAMTIADIRPAEDRAALERNVAAVTEGWENSGPWRHCLKSGDIIHVDITGHTLEHEGRRAELIAARDVSMLVLAEQIAREAFAREQAARRSSEALARQFQVMFDSVPGLFVVFSPETFDIIAVSEAFLATVGRSRAEIVGRNLFDALPRQPDDETHASLRDSFRRVLETGRPDLMEVQRFRLPRPGMRGQWEERHWLVSNLPVKAPDGRLLHLMARLQDVSDVVDAVGVASGDGPAPAPARLDLVAHTRELKSDNLRLAEQAAWLRTTQRLLNSGTWTYRIAEDRLDWSDNVYAMYGTSAEDFGHRLADYDALIHPDDRDIMRERFTAFLQSDETYFAFAHRSPLPDGSIVHLHGVGERIDTMRGVMLGGVVQNVTDSVEAAQALARAKRLLEIAGTSAAFGAWHYDPVTQRVEWSDQTARIHEEPEGFSPTLERGIAYYAPEYREHLVAKVQSCLEHGEPFSGSHEIITAKGRRRWVRVTAEAERDASGRIIGLQGSFQDISELESVRKRAEESEKLLEIAGRAVKLGGWSVSLADNRVSWTEGIARIHELPPGSATTFDGGIDYFAPEDRASARQVFEDCAVSGIPFDNVREIITARGNRVKVRSLGEPVRDETGRIVAVQGAMQDITELTEARHKAETLSQKLLRTFESIRDGFITMDRDWRFTLVNTEATRLLQMDADSLLGRVVWEAFPLLEQSDFGRHYKSAMATGETQRFVSLSGDMNRWYDVAAFPSDEGLSVYFQDVTEKRQQQERLRLLQAAVSQLNDIVVITEAGRVDAPDHPRIVYLNDAFTRLSGYTLDEALGRTPRFLQGPKTQRAELDRIRNALEAFEPVRAEVINYRKTGEEYWLEIDILPLSNGAGEVTHFVAVQRDITGRRLAEEALHVSETRFRFIAEATGNAVWERDLRTERLWWSAGLAAIFGHKPDPEGTLPTVWRANLHPDDESAVDDAMARLLSGRSDTTQMRYRFRRADGKWAMVEDRAFVIRNEDDQAIRILGSMTDISERLNLEDRLRQSQKLEAVGQLTGGVAHDFNNLLTVIMGNTELLQDGLGDTHPLRQFADISAKAVDRAAELTNRLLAFSRKQALQPRVIDVNAVVSGLEDLLRRTLGADIDIAITRAGELWHTEADLGQLEDALLNLAINSRDAMPEGGSLTIETANASLDEDYTATEPGLMAGQYVVIAVSDTGTGIPPELLPRVFEPFYTTKAVGKGTGLGLSMVYGFVKQTGGHIRLYSEPGEGTTVKLYFPRSHDEDPAPEPEPGNSQLEHGRETILVVEDDRLIREQLAAQLIGLGYTVLTASEGPAALAVLRDRPDIDLLFTDVILPGGMNGRQIADAAREIRPGIKVLYTSGYSENAIVHHGRLDPGVELLSKPYRRFEMVAKIRKVLDS